ncbi:MAG TPA: hypothetical protein VEL52_07895 [Candidatus Bathyarchaeia archaeon]|nr:hypothetical protein [Candidatus Bathyarchaeia archaeon]
MDKRFLVSAIATDAVGIALFLAIYENARIATSLSSVASRADIAISILVISVASGAILATIGVVHRLGISSNTAVGLGLASFVLGLSSLYLSFGSVVGYGDDQAACGGFPPGYWTSNGQLNRCSIWIVVHEDWLATLFLVVLATAAIIFWASIITRVRSSEVENRNEAVAAFDSEATKGP